MLYVIYLAPKYIEERLRSCFIPFLINDLPERNEFIFDTNPTL